jgi:excisionase family DNA binding protein
MSQKETKSRAFEYQKALHNHSGKRLYTLKEASEYLGRTVWAMRDLVYSGGVPHVRLPGERRYYFDVVDLDELIKRNKSSY